MPPAARAGGRASTHGFALAYAERALLHHLERKGQAGQIQELRRVSLHIGKSYTSHTWDLLSWAAQHAIRGLFPYTQRCARAMMTRSTVGLSLAHWRSVRWSQVFLTTQGGDRIMLTCGLKRSVLLLLCVASVLFSGCVSQGKYDDLQSQI